MINGEMFQNEFEENTNDGNCQGQQQILSMKKQ